MLSERNARNTQELKLRFIFFSLSFTDINFVQTYTRAHFFPSFRVDFMIVFFLLLVFLLTEVSEEETIPRNRSITSIRTKTHQNCSGKCMLVISMPLHTYDNFLTHFLVSSYWLFQSPSTFPIECHSSSQSSFRKHSVCRFQFVKKKLEELVTNTTSWLPWQRKSLEMTQWNDKIICTQWQVN